MKTQQGTAAQRAVPTLLLLLATSPLTATFEVSVRRADGAAAAGATVCLGTTLDLNQFDRRTTDAQGRVSFASSPQTSFVVTASLDGRGSQQQRTGASSPGSGGAPPPSFGLMTLTLPGGAGGPSCPSGPAGNGGPLVPPDAIAKFTPPPGLRPTIGTIDIRREVCFGALGMKCGEPQPPLPATALCSGGSCAINAGSWAHDECCFADPNGKACKNGPFGTSNGNCAAEFDKAVRLVGKSLFWRRNIDFNRVNNTGRVEFATYCAPTHTLLNPGDARLCCSGQARALNPAEITAAAAVNETLVACR